ncbi:MAG: hypothetical protein ACTHJR_16490 [Sphingomonas sp.]|uniref:hypothetical protein n=1 Tax=Sphingomonas sp. TaxID=28214 RepID=UPI003F81D7DC
MDSGTITPAVDAISDNITISAVDNQLPTGDLIGSRDLDWSFTVGGVAVNDSLRYTLQASLPFAVSCDGVRTKLGVQKKDLPDDQIDLVRAYLSFRDSVTGAALDAADISDPLTLVTIRDAIEATAAFALIPTMAVRVASKETSGTNQFQLQDVDWEAVGASLQNLIVEGVLIIDPTFDPSANFTGLFIVAYPDTDTITGA